MTKTKEEENADDLFDKAGYGLVDLAKELYLSSNEEIEYSSVLGALQYSLCVLCCRSAPTTEKAFAMIDFIVSDFKKYTLQKNETES